MFSKLLITLFCVHFAIGSKPWEPVKGSDNWMKKHEKLLKQTADHHAEIKAVFLGASGTENWMTDGRPLWESYYVKHGAANYGIGGDTTSNVLWRIQNKELDGLTPKVIWFSVGPGFNMMARNAASIGADTLRGLEEIIKELRAKFPSSKLIIFGHTPYNHWPEIDAAGKHNNIELKKLADDKDVFFFNPRPLLVNSKDEQLTQMFKTDHLHLSLEGYTVLHENMKALFEKLLK